MSVYFFDWLQGQKQRQDPVGDLARDVARDTRFPRGEATATDVYDYLEAADACLDCTKAAARAWKEYQAAEGRKN